MRRGVKRALQVFAAVSLILTAVLYVGFRWGLPPYPRPPPGVRLSPIRAALGEGDLATNNAAYCYKQAGEWLAGRRFSTPIADQISSVLANDLPPDTHLIETAVGECQWALDELRSGVEQPMCQVPLPGLGDATNQWYQGLRSGVRLLEVNAHLAARDGDWTVAIRDSLASMKIGQDVTIGGGVTLYLVGSALQGMGAATVRALVLQTEVPAAQLRVAIRDLQSRRGTGQPVAETLRYELAALGKVLSGTDSDLLPASRFTLSADRTRRQFEAAYGDLIAESEKPFWLSKPALVRQRWRFEAEPLWLRVFQQPVAKLLVDMNLLGVSDLGARAARVQLEWDATMVTCALVLFRRDHGKTAATLADLAPAYLLAVPSDPFCGEPLRYRVDGQNWVLWSVGSDGVDNAARFQEFRHRNESGELAGGDIFYTSTEPQVDRERYRDCLKKSKRPQ